jgi:hypothetical protein
LILTGGDGAGNPAERLEESRQAAMILGSEVPVCWNLPDRGLHADEALVARLRDHMTQLGVDLVYAPSPWELHPDHRQAAAAVLRAAHLSASALTVALYEVSWPLHPNVLLDISPVQDRKHAAMQCFVSQNARQHYCEQVEALNRFRTFTLPPETRAAEALCVLESAAIEHYLRTGHMATGVEHVRLEQPGALPLVSVLVRSRGRRGHLFEALDSVALQTYPHIEVVVMVVEAKPDHTALPQRCGPFPLRQLDCPESLEPGQMANRALALARGDFVLILDDENWLMPSHIARLADVLVRQPLAPAAYGGVSLVDARGAPLGQVLDAPYDAPHDGIWPPASGPIPIHAVLFRQAVQHSTLQFDEASGPCDDRGFLRQLAQRGPLVHLPGVSAAHRQRDAKQTPPSPSPDGQDTLQHALSASEAALTDARASLEAMRSSSSWRLTAPLRFIKSVWRGVWKP